jgi:hypothetical protein
MIRRFIFGTICLIVSVVMVGGGLEMLLRLIEPTGPAPIGTPDAHYHVATDEFGFDVVNNAQGFRADHTIGEKSPASYRIAAIGGSIVFGWGVDGEKSFLAVIERTLGTTIAPRQIEVVNLGRPGADVADYERVERDLALPLKPDLILLTFFYGRDSVVGLPDAWGMTPDSAYKGAKAYVASKQHPPDTSGLRVVRRLEVLRQPNFWKALLTAPEGKCSRVWDHPNATVTRAVLERSYGPKELAAFDRLDRAGWIAKARRCEIMPYRINHAVMTESYWADILGIVPRKRPMVERLWQVSNETLLEMASMAKAARVPLLVVGFPTAFSADPAAHAFSAELGEQPYPALLTDDSAARSFTAYCEANNMLCRDFQPEVRRAVATGDARYFFPRDGHLTAEGNRLVGELIADEVAPIIAGTRAVDLDALRDEDIGKWAALAAVAAKIDPAAAVAHQKRADALRAKGDLGGALAAYSLAIEVSPPNTALFYMRGTLRFELGDKAGAVEDFDEGLRLDPSNPTLVSLRAKATAPPLQ